MLAELACSPGFRAHTPCCIPKLGRRGPTAHAELSSHINAYVYVCIEGTHLWLCKYRKCRNRAVANQTKRCRTVHYPNPVPALAALQELSVFNMFWSMNPILSEKQTGNQGSFLILLPILCVCVQVTLFPCIIHLGTADR